MQRTVVICIATVTCWLNPCATSAANPSDSAADRLEERYRVRRFAQVAEIRTERLQELRKLASQSASAIQAVLANYNLKNHSMFAIELEPNRYYALRYHEHDGKNSVEDMHRLKQDERYKQWADKLDSCLLGDWEEVQSVFYTVGQRRSRVPEERVKRLGRVIGLRPEMAEPYILLHAHTWPGVLSAIREGNIRNYSIFLAPIGSKLYLFSYSEYVGDDLQADMDRIGSDPDTRAWIKFTDEGCQLPLSTRKPGEWWASMERL